VAEPKSVDAWPGVIRGRRTNGGTARSARCSPRSLRGQGVGASSGSGRGRGRESRQAAGGARDAKGRKVRGGRREMDMIIKGSGASVLRLPFDRDLRGDAKRRAGCGIRVDAYFRSGGRKCRGAHHPSQYGRTGSSSSPLMIRIQILRQAAGSNRGGHHVRRRRLEKSRSSPPKDDIEVSTDMKAVGEGYDLGRAHGEEVRRSPRETAWKD